MSWALLLTGMPNSGKSTLAYNLVQKRVRNCLVIDGDKHREMQFLGEELGFERADIMKNTEHVVKLARFAQEQEINVLIAQIAPYKEQRALMRSGLFNFIEVYCQCPDYVRAFRPNFTRSKLVYEFDTPDLIVDTGQSSIQDCVDIILGRVCPA